MEAKRPKPLPKLYYDVSSRKYWLQLETGRYLDLDKADAQMHLIDAGLDDPESYKDGMKKITRFYLNAQKDRCVDYAGPLAGHQPKQFQTASGLEILVTRGFKFIEGKAGRCKAFEKFMVELLPDEQWMRYIAWLKLSRLNLKRGSFSPAPAQVFAGKARCGKSFLQTLTTHLLGGRVCKPYPYMIGATTHNRDLAEAEHWMIEDEHPSTNVTARRKFGTQLKEATVNMELRIRAMFRDGIVMSTFRRVTISVNDEPENLAMLPPLDDSLIGKLCLFKCGMAELDSNYAANWKTFEAELPAFAHFVDSFSIPTKWKGPLGIEAFHHPELIRSVDEISPDHQFREIVDGLGLWKDNESWRGCANELEALIRRSPFGFQAEKILLWSAATGSYLGKWEKAHPKRIKCSRGHAGKTTWTIHPPEPEEES